MKLKHTLVKLSTFTFFARRFPRQIKIASEIEYRLMKINSVMPDNKLKKIFEKVKKEAYAQKDENSVYILERLDQIYCALMSGQKIEEIISDV